jgi:hypothetical protein
LQNSIKELSGFHEVQHPPDRNNKNPIGTCLCFEIPTAMGDVI